NGWADFIPGPASNFDFVKNSKSLPQIAQEVRPYRVIFGNRMLYPIQVGGQKYVVNYPQDASVVFPMKNFGGYNPLALQSKKDLARIPLDVAVELGALKGILSLDGNLKIQGFKPVPFLPFFLYEYQKSLSYVFAPKSLLLTGQELDWLQKPGFDAAQSAVFSNPLPGEWTKGLGMSKPLPGVSRAWNYLKPCHLQYQLTLDGVDVQRFEVALDQDRVVVFAEAMFPGWKAWVDGQPAPLSTADHILRALHMTAGHHEVEFRFEPAWWTPIRVGLALWLLITLIVLLAILRKNFFAILQKIYYSIGGHGLGRIKLLRWAYDTLFKLFKPKSVMVQGHRMWLDDKDTLELAVHEVYEPVETGLLKEHLKPGQVFVDIGANIGYYTLLATRIVGPKGKVYAFEPDPTNFTLLQKNISTNGYTNVVAVNKALSNKAGTAKLYINPSNRGDHRIYDSHDGRPSVEIAMTTVDEYFKKLDKKVHFIKMDIQGAEAAALAGMKGLIRKNKGLKLVTEFSPGALKAFGADPQRYLKDLAALGFRFLEISEKKKSVKPVTPAQLLKRKWGGSEDYTNL
ncbi:MAG TPA: FkbM family methyltransferase, partial [bacterium]|nr:FkbM family methyltransferase [bacterium]